MIRDGAPLLAVVLCSWCINVTFCQCMNPDLAVSVRYTTGEVNGESFAVFEGSKCTYHASVPPGVKSVTLDFNQTESVLAKDVQLLIQASHITIIELVGKVTATPIAVSGGTSEATAHLIVLRIVRQLDVPLHDSPKFEQLILAYFEMRPLVSEVPDTSIVTIGIVPTSSGSSGLRAPASVGDVVIGALNPTFDKDIFTYSMALNALPEMLYVIATSNGVLSDASLNGGALLCDGTVNSVRSELTDGLQNRTLSFDITGVNNETETYVVVIHSTRGEQKDESGGGTEVIVAIGLGVGLVLVVVGFAVGRILHPPGDEEDPANSRKERGKDAQLRSALLGGEGRRRGRSESMTSDESRLSNASGSEARAGDAKELDMSRVTVDGTAPWAGGSGVRLRGRYAGRDVALKQMASESVAEFETEAWVLHRVQHSHVLRMFGTGVKGQDRFIVTEFLADTLWDLMRRQTALAPSAFLSLACELAQALAHVHARGVTHRDLRPHTVFLDARGRVKLGGFSLAALAAGPPLPANPMRFSADYSAPELVLNSDCVDGAVDVFSFAMVLTALRTLSPPPADPTATTNVISHCFPADLGRLLLACVNGDPRRRPSFPVLYRALRGMGGTARAGSNQHNSNTSPSQPQQTQPGQPVLHGSPTGAGYGVGMRPAAATSSLGPGFGEIEF